jgi:hypothetical protein
MKTVFLLLVLLHSFSAWALDPGGPSLVGHWLYYKKIFQGHEMPEPPEATLRLHFDFEADGSDHLYWWHEGEKDLCERKGTHTVENGNTLVDTNTWVNPKNDSSCANDPDMQQGRVTRTPISFAGADLQFFLALGDDTLIYVWRREPPKAQGIPR